MTIFEGGGVSITGGISLGWGSNQDGSSQEFSNGESGTNGATVDCVSHTDVALIDVPSGTATSDWIAVIDTWEADGLRLDVIDTATADRALGFLLVEVDRQVIDLTDEGIPSAAAWGTPTVVAGEVTLSPGGIASVAAWGTPSLTAGAVTVSPSGIASAVAWGTPTLLAGAVILSPSSFGTGPVWGSPTVQPGVVFVSPSGIPSSSAWGTPSVLGGNLIVSPFGIPSAAAWGIPFLTGGVQVVTLKALIENALREAAQLGSFHITVRNTDTREVTTGLQVAPAEVEVNEVASAYAVADEFGREYIQDRRQWQWLLILRFHQEVITEVFENALLRDPVLVSRNPAQGIVRQARLLLLDSKVQHPPRGGSSNGTEVTYRFNADLGHA